MLSVRVWGWMTLAAAGLAVAGSKNESWLLLAAPKPGTPTLPLRNELVGVRKDTFLDCRMSPSCSPSSFCTSLASTKFSLRGIASMTFGALSRCLACDPVATVAGRSRVTLEGCFESSRSTQPCYGSVSPRVVYPSISRHRTISVPRTVLR